MVALVNRNPTGRLICIHALVKYLYSIFASSTFTLSDMKYDSERNDNILNNCESLVKLPSIPYKVCPFLDNPLSDAKCYLTQSKLLDTQKSKSVSDVSNALEGLGLIFRSGNRFHLTTTGIKFAKTDYFSKEWLILIRKCVVGYGPFIGLLYLASINSNQKNPRRIIKSEIKLGYPKTEEYIRIDKNLITLSTGSQKDTITRTRAVLFSWAVSSGFAYPLKITKPPEKDIWQIQTLGFVREKTWNSHMYHFDIPEELFCGNHIVNKPLNYRWMTKSTKALRERGQENIRKISLRYERIIKNRRFCIVFALAKCSDLGKNLNFNNLINVMRRYPSLFVIEEIDFHNIMLEELSIAFVTGIPYTLTSENLLKPLTKLNMNALTEGAPNEIVETVNTIISDNSIINN